MATADAGLEIPIGFTEQKALQQLARIEARAIKSATQQQQKFVKANQAVADSFGKMSNAARGQLQNVSFQLQDIFVQISSGTSATQALSQQLPQLLGGFGALGAALGLAAAVAVPLIGSLFSIGDAADEVADRMADLEKAVTAYREAAELAAMPTAELVAKYGAAAGEVRVLYVELARLAEFQAMQKLSASFDTLGNQFGAVRDLINQINAELSLGAGETGLVTSAVQKLSDEYGMTVDQASNLVGLLDALKAADGIDAQRQAAQALFSAFNDVVAAGGKIPPEMVKTAQETGEALSQAYDLNVALNDAATAAANVAGQAGSIDFSGAIAGANSLAAALARASSAAAAMSAHGVFIGPDGAIQTNRTGQRDPSTDWRFRGPLDPNRETLKTRREREAAEKAREEERLAKLLAGGSGGGGGRKSSKGRGGSAAKPEPSIFERTERDAVALQRQIELLGKSSEEAATAKARWEMLDEAKKRGLPVNETLNAQIDAQAANVGRLTGELERAEIAQDRFEEAINTIADTMAGVLVGGESLRDGLADIFQGIASDILNSGIRNALMGQFGGGLLNRIVGGGDPLTGALRMIGLPARATGGAVTAGQMYMTGELGPEPFIPAVNGRILSVSQAQAALRGGSGGGSMNVTIDLRGTTGDRALDEKIRVGAAQAVAQANRAMPSRVAEINRDPLRR